MYIQNIRIIASPQQQCWGSDGKKRKPTTTKQPITKPASWEPPTVEEEAAAPPEATEAKKLSTQVKPSLNLGCNNWPSKYWSWGSLAFYVNRRRKDLTKERRYRDFADQTRINRMIFLQFNLMLPKKPLSCKDTTRVETLNNSVSHSMVCTIERRRRKRTKPAPVVSSVVAARRDSPLLQPFKVGFFFFFFFFILGMQKETWTWKGWKQRNRLIR